MDKYLISLYQSGKGKYILYARDFFLFCFCETIAKLDWTVTSIKLSGRRQCLSKRNDITCEHKSLDIRHPKLAMETNDSLFAILICNFILQSLLIGRFVDIYTGVIGDTFSARATSANIDSVALQRSVGHLGALYLLPWTLRRLVSLWLEVLQRKERQQLNQQ